MINVAAGYNGLKQWFSPSRVENMTQSRFPLVSMLRKRKDLTGGIAGGKPFVTAMLGGNGASGSADIGTAINNSGFAPIAGFNLFSCKDYVAPTIDAALIEASMSSEGAFFSIHKKAIELALKESAQAQALNVMGDGTGIRATVQYVPSTNGLTSTQVQISDLAQNVNFQAANNGSGGTVVQFAYNNQGSWALRNSGQQCMCTGKNPTTGILTFSGGLPAGIVVGDILVRAADLPAGTQYSKFGITTGARFAGVSGYIPLNPPVPGGGDMFGQLDRSFDPWKFAGGRFDGTGRTATDLLNGALGVVRSQDGDSHPDIFVVNSFAWANIEADLEGRRNVQKEQIKGAGSIGFSSLRVDSPDGIVNIVMDNTWPSNRGDLLQLDTWNLWSMNGPHVRMLDYIGYGEANIPSQTLDAIQSRIGTRGALLECTAPGANCAVQLK